MKLHDIENTVAQGRRERRAARRHVPHRARLSADHEGRGRGAAGLGPEDSRRHGAHLLRRHRSRRVRLLARASTRWSRAARSRRSDIGVDGLVCSPEEASPLRLVVGNDMLFVTPGMRPAGRARRPEARRDAGAGDQGGRGLSGGRPADHRRGRSESRRAGDRRRDRGERDQSKQKAGRRRMPKAYWIGRVDVSNPEGYKAYVAANADAVQEIRREVPGARRAVRKSRRRKPLAQRRARVQGLCDRARLLQFAGISGQRSSCARRIRPATS